jgi:hypothetical protein
VKHDREQIAHRYGFASFMRLLAISRPLPRLNQGAPQSYIAHRSDGRWFVWDDVPPGKGGEGTRKHDPRTR